MCNPLGGTKRGWAEIREVYEDIFGRARVRVEFRDFEIAVAGDIFIAVGREEGYFDDGKRRIDLSIRTSRVFRLIDGAWKQIHHHGSIVDPLLLRSYQEAVLGVRA